MIHHKVYYDDCDFLYCYYTTGKRVMHMEFDKMLNKFTNGKTDDSMEIYDILLDTEPLHTREPPKRKKIQVTFKPAYKRRAMAAH